MKKEMIKLEKYNLKEIEKVLDDEFNEAGNTIVFFLDDEEYGYGYTYSHVYGSLDEDFVKEGVLNCTMFVHDRFTEEELLGGIDELIGAENRKTYIGHYTSNSDAVYCLLSFWSNMEKGAFIQNDISIEEVVQLGKEYKLDYIIF